MIALRRQWKCMANGKSENSVPPMTTNSEDTSEIDNPYILAPLNLHSSITSVRRDCLSSSETVEKAFTPISQLVSTHLLISALAQPANDFVVQGLHVVCGRETIPKVCRSS